MREDLSSMVRVMMGAGNVLGTEMWWNEINCWYHGRLCWIWKWGEIEESLLFELGDRAN